MRLHGDVSRRPDSVSARCSEFVPSVISGLRRCHAGQVFAVQKQILESFSANIDEAQAVQPKKENGLWRIAGSKGTTDFRRHVQFETKRNNLERR